LLKDLLGYIVIPVPRVKMWAKVLIERLGKLLLLDSSQPDINSVLDRIIFIRPLNESEYITLCAVFDVVLDPFPVGGGRSALEIFSTANIVVLQEDATSVLHLTSGMYRAMGINATTCCIAANEDQYVAKSYLIASNSTYQDELRKELFLRKNVLYENHSVIGEWERLLTLVVSSPRPEPRLCPTLFGAYEEPPLPQGMCSESDIAPENVPYEGQFAQSYRCNPIILESQIMQVCVLVVYVFTRCYLLLSCFPYLPLFRIIMLQRLLIAVLVTAHSSIKTSTLSTSLPRMNTRKRSFPLID
jgi:hypothetical protein